MKKILVVFVAVMVAVAVAVPAMAKVEFSYGGQFRVRYISQSNFSVPFSQTGTAQSAFNAATNSDDDLSRFDERLRLYFTFTASENLKLVTKFEVGDAVWGNDNAAGGKADVGRVGADATAVEVKNMYIDFNIPNGLMPLNAKIGTQPFVFIDSWVVDDDFSGAYLNTKMDVWKIGLGYIGAQNNDVFDTTENIDDYFLHINYVCGPFSAEFVTFAQSGHDTAVSADPGTLNTPAGAVNKYIPSFAGNFSTTLPRNFYQRALQSPNDIGPFGDVDFVRAGQNNLVDLGLQLKYKDDVLSGYLNFVKNLGVVDFKRFNAAGGGLTDTVTAEYEGWMVDIGGAYYCGPWTFNLGGFYTTGPEDIQNQFKLRSHQTNYDVTWFTYPLGTTKYFSEILGHGILDNNSPSHEDMQWKGAANPMNLWTVNLGAAWQVLPGTKLAFGYWYFGTAEDVVSGFRNNGPTALGGLSQDGKIANYFANNVLTGDLDFDDSLGHELNFYITQKVVDGLMLDLVAAYLFAGDAYSIRDDDEDALELGARLQWNF